MSSGSDDRVSDHSQQIVDSIEPVEQPQTEDVESSEGERRETSGPRSTLKRRGFIRPEPTMGSAIDEGGDSSSDSGSPGSPREGPGRGHRIASTQFHVAHVEDSDFGNESDSSKDATGSRADRGRRVDDYTSDEVASGDEDELSERQPPTSYQTPVRVAGDFSGPDTANTSSKDSIRRAVEMDLLPEDATRNQRKSRKRNTSMHGPQPRATDGVIDSQHMKKAKTTLNRAYLDVLNQDIEHAAFQGCATYHEKLDKRIALPSSQIGVSFWTPMEKERFFEALGRLGRDNTAGIAERVHTKGEMEVRQYMKLLQDALSYRQQQNELDPLGLEDIPSALELSHECCQALEEVADDIAMRQERVEIAADAHEYGPSWLVSRENCESLKDEAEDDISKPAGVFRTKEWLSLSERFFMNAPTAEGNWQSVDGNAPSLRLTTLNEFHSLALTLTKRLVAASHYMATTRIRAESGWRRQLRKTVKDRDVRAAALSLGLASRKPPLMGCVRRLGLSVHEKPPKQDEGSDLEPMSVTDVEDAFDIEGLRNTSRLRYPTERVTLSNQGSISSDSLMESDTEENGEGDDRSASGNTDSGEEEEEEEEIKAEANEAILYSAVDPPQTKRDRQALHRRIQAERQQERYTNAVDAHRGYVEEVKMWKLLGQPPPEDLIDPGPLPRARRVNLSVDAAYSVGRDWRANTRAMSEWEAQYLGIS